MGVFEIQLDSTELFIKDHLVAGYCVFPGAAYIELAIANFEFGDPIDGVKVKRIRINSPMVFLPGVKKNVRIKYDKKDAVNTFQISSCNQEGLWETHVEGEIYAYKPERSSTVDINQFYRNCTNKVDSEEVYKLYSKAVLDYGSFYKSIDKVLFNQAEVIANLCLNHVSRINADDFIVHPALLDGAFQAAGIPAFYEDSGKVFLPYYIEELTYCKPLPERCMSISRKRESTRPDGPIKKYDLYICTEEGQVCVEVRGLTIKSAEMKKQESVSTRPALDNSNLSKGIFTQQTWREHQLSNQEADVSGETWILFTDEVVLAGKLAVKLSQRGVIPVTVSMKAGEISADGYVLQNGNIDDYKKVFNQIYSEKGHIGRILHLAALTKDSSAIDSGEQFEANLNKGPISVFNILKSYTSIKQNGTIPMTIISSNITGVIEGEEVRYEHSSMLGLVKSANMENTGLLCSVLDFTASQEPLDEYMKNVVKVLLDKRLAVHTAIRNGKAYVPDIEDIDMPAAKEVITQIKEGGTYLITGGIGGIGLALCDYISSFKGTKIGLINRTPFPDREKWAGLLKENKDTKIAAAIQKFMAFEKCGIRIYTYAADVSDYTRMNEVVAQFEKEAGSINGIIHAAGFLRDKLISTMTGEDFISVLKPKIYGLYNLDRIMKNRKYDFFVLCSSLSSVTGNAGQANYSAANASLDAYAKRSTQNRRIISINWSTWEEGMATKAVLEANRKKGMLAISNKTGIAAFEQILKSGHNQVTVLQADPSLFDLKGLLHKIMGLDMIPELPSNKVETKKPKLSKKSLKAMAQDIILDILSNALKLDKKEFDNQAAFTDYGMDSIVAGEMIQTLSERLQVQLEATMFFEYKNIEDLADYLTENFRGEICSALGGEQEESESHYESGETLDEKVQEMYSEKMVSNAEAEAAVTFENKSRDVISVKHAKSLVEETIIDILSQTLKLDHKEFDRCTAFTDYGMDSIVVGEIVGVISEKLKIQLEPTLFFEYKTLEELTDYIVDNFMNEILLVFSINLEDKEADLTFADEVIEAETDHFVKEEIQSFEAYEEASDSRWEIPTVENKVKIDTINERQVEESRNDDIAIIGFSCRFPDASDVEEFWNNLITGKDSVTDIPKDRWDWKECFENGDVERFGLTSAKAGFVNGIDTFDASFFNISPSEAKVMDPQQRMMLMLAWEAFETAGYAGQLMDSNTGVYVGSSYNHYMDEVMGSMDYDSPYTVMGNLPAIIANRISYTFGLQGPSVYIGTLCSSSTVSIISACQGLKNGLCDMAVAGGIRLLVPPAHYIGFSRINMLSSDGKCKSFDKSADGIVSGEGGALVVLKRLDRALEDGDKIYGVIKGYAENHNGKSNGLMAPNPQAQEKLIMDAFKNSEVDPSELSYIEANGTGTEYGDTLELKALTNVFGKFTDKKSYCAIGSVKTNIGHLEPSSGIAGLLKVLMSFKYRMLPPTLHFTGPNPAVKLSQSPFYISDKVQEFSPQKRLRTAAVSSFGMGGTNTYIIVQEPDSQMLHKSRGKKSKREMVVVPISARTEAALLKIAENMKKRLSQMVNADIFDIALTLGKGRKHFEKRHAMICHDIDQLLDKLELFILKGKQTYNSSGNSQYTSTKCVFVIPDASRLDAGEVLLVVQRLIKEEIGFENHYNKFLSVFDSADSADIYKLLADTRNEHLLMLSQKQKAIMVLGFQYAFSQVLSNWGIKPYSFVGEGTGKILASILEDNAENFSGDTLRRINEALTKTYEISDHGLIRNIEAVSNYGIVIELGFGKGSFEDASFRKQISDMNILWLCACGKGRDGTRLIHDIVGKVYTAGVSVNWEAYLDNAGSMVDLPLYPFDNKRHWVTPKKALQNERLQDVSEHYKYTTNMQSAAMPGDGNLQYVDSSVQHIDPLQDSEYIENIAEIFVDEMSRNLGYTKDEIDCSIELDNYGFDSIMAGKVVSAYENAINRELDPTSLFEYNTINKYANFLFDNYKDEFKTLFCEGRPVQQPSGKPDNIGKALKKDTDSERVKEDRNNIKGYCGDIAIIGMAGMFPGALNTEEFFEKLSSEYFGITEIPKERWDIDQYYSEDPEEPGKTNCRYGSFLENIDKFEPGFFGISANKAALIDPQQRLMLQAAWHAVEDAGYGNKKIEKTKTGVYIGICNNEYIHIPERDYSKLSPHIASGNSFSVVANRISYFLNVQGPSLAIDTACSSSMVALHNACQSILSGESEMALVGGVNLTLSPGNHIVFSKASVLAPDGIVKPFDENGKGYVRGEGVAAVLLKPLSKAIEDRDNIHAVIKGTAVMHSGQTNGLNTPSPSAQRDVIIEACKKSGVDIETISYVESHATGTELGDHAEFKGLTDAFRQFTNKIGYCALSSIKGNIGHLEAASGLVSMIKVILSLKHKKIIPVKNFNKRNKMININSSPFFINDKVIDWDTGDMPRRAGVNSFGFGGTNVHVILEEAPEKENLPDLNENKGMIAVLSSRYKSTLGEMAVRLAEYVKADHEIINLGDVCYTLGCGRSHHPIRLAIEAATRNEMIKKLEKIMVSGLNTKGIIYGEKVSKQPYPVFITAEVYEDVILNLYHSYSGYKEYADELLSGFGIERIPRLAEWLNSKQKNEEFVKEEKQLLQVLHNVSLFRFLQKLGIPWSAVVGSKINNYSAMIAGQVISAEEIADIIFEKGEEPDLVDRTSAIPVALPWNGKYEFFNSQTRENQSLKNIDWNSKPDVQDGLFKTGKDYSFLEAGEIQNAASLRGMLADLYVKGRMIKWENYYEGEVHNIISLPEYKFYEKGYWHEKDMKTI